MNIDDQRLRDILLKENYLAPEDLEQAEVETRLSKTPLLDYLLREGLINRELLGQAIAESFSLPFADLKLKLPSREQILKIPQDLAQRFKVALYEENNKEIVVATDNPKEPDLLPKLKKVFPHENIKLAYSLPEDLEEIFVYYRKPLETRFSQIIKTQERIAPEIFEEIVGDALALRATDIHFEPQDKEVVIRFRIDGFLHEAGRVSKEYYENILNRIKIQSRLRLDEHFSGQDGAIRFVKDSRTVDLRVSIIPTQDGEKVALRLLSEYVKGFSLTDLGLSSAKEQIFLEAAKKPFGMVLVTGPTGSGKTTTLYALLRLLNHPEVNITTIEDPVEYKVMGINQIQVNPQTNLSFAKGLRSIIRQDPNIILVGEIRDNETAEIAVNAALTGHLLLSTFHANDASGAIPRLMEMKVEPYLLASTLELIVAQRLVRKICQRCRLSQQVGAQKYFPKGATLYRGKGCNVCNQTGYHGRTAIFEMIKVSPKIKELMLQNPSSEKIWSLAKKEETASMFEDGLEKVKSGTTTLEELLRVTSPSF